MPFRKKLKDGHHVVQLMKVGSRQIKLILPEVLLPLMINVFPKGLYRLTLQVMDDFCDPMEKIFIGVRSYLGGELRNHATTRDRVELVWPTILNSKFRWPRVRSWA